MKRPPRIDPNIMQRVLLREYDVDKSDNTTYDREPLGLFSLNLGIILHRYMDPQMTKAHFNTFYGFFRESDPNLPILSTESLSQSWDQLCTITLGEPMLKALAKKDVRWKDAFMPHYQKLLKEGLVERDPHYFRIANELMIADAISLRESRGTAAGAVIGPTAALVVYEAMGIELNRPPIHQSIPN